MSLVAITRDLGSDLATCELTHLDRDPIDLALAREQHEAYRSALRDLGCHVEKLPALPGFPDSVFVEDVAVVLGTTVVLTRPGAESRRDEVDHFEPAIAPYGVAGRIEAPGTLDGGDVLVQGRTAFVGLTTRTNDAGLAQLAALAEPHGYVIRPVEVRGCLHLKSAATSVTPDRILANPEWIDIRQLQPWGVISVHPEEPFAANALPVGKTVLYPAAFPRTAALLRAQGVVLRAIDNSELAKAEGALTCCSVILEDPGPSGRSA